MRLFYLIGLSAERSVFHIAVTIFAASHLVLFLSIIALRHLQIQILLDSFQEKGSPPLLADILPATNALTYERILMKDKRIPQAVFASRVLLAINGNVINEKMAKDLLYGSGYKLQEIASRVYSLTKDEKRTRRRDNEV